MLKARLRRGGEAFSMEFDEGRGRYDTVPVEVLSLGPPLVVRLNHAAVERHPARVFLTEQSANEESARWNDWFAGRTLAPTPLTD